MCDRGTCVDAELCAIHSRRVRQVRVLGHSASRPEPPTFTLMSPLSTPHADDTHSAPTCHSCPTTSSSTITPPFNDEHSKGSGLKEVTLMSPCLAHHVGVLDNREQRPASTTRTPSSSKPTSRPLPTTRCHATSVQPVRHKHPSRRVQRASKKSSAPTKPSSCTTSVPNHTHLTKREVLARLLAGCAEVAGLPVPTKADVRSQTINLFATMKRLPIATAAEFTNTSQSTLKRYCRSLGLNRWQHRSLSAGVILRNESLAEVFSCCA